MSKTHYEKLLSLVRKNYPELDNSKIIIELKEMEKYSMFAKRISKGNYKILIDPKKCSIGDDGLKGKLAHELAHFKRFETWNFIRFFFDNLLYRFVIYRRWTERFTDKIAIKKGFAKELIINRKISFDRLSKEKSKLFKEMKKIYMSPGEIKDYSNNFIINKIYKD